MTQPSQDFIDAKRAARMAAVDAMSAELRDLVHCYGMTVVQSFQDCGVRRPKRIRHLVETVLDEFSPTRGAKSAQGPRAAIGRDA